MVKIARNFLDVAIFVLMVTLAILLCVGSNYQSAIFYGINLWVGTLLPALFPYFFITAVLSSLKSTGKLANFLSPIFKFSFNISGLGGYAYIMSLISGYPIGANIACDLKNGGLIDKTEAERVSAVASTSSPMFLIATIGGIMFSSLNFGLILFATHLISSIIIGIIFSFYKRKEKPKTNTTFSPNKVDNLLYESIFSSVNSTLFIGGLITIFSLMLEVLTSLNLLTPIIKGFSFVFGDFNLAKGFTFGLLECTNGLKALSVCGIMPLTLPLVASLCGFGGLSVIFQSLTFLKKAKIKATVFVCSKLLSMALNFIIGLIFSNLFLL
ncbi:MAG: hypothetical protein IKW33_03815 [Clostridia bacterium]|nr:hypothetical protein [Clostridia bacterium]